jgi:predicted dehydrogenase
MIGHPLTISARFREYWGGIFGAHPWLSGPKESYLGFYDRGGGASGEHSHAINIWQHFAHLLHMGRIVEVSAMLDLIDDGKVKYDRICQLNVKTEEGFIGSIVQDVITEPAQKNLRIQGSNGFLEWYVNYDKDNDALVYGDCKSGVRQELIPKKRPDDFIGEIDHLQDILEGKTDESPISLERGLDTMMIIAAAHSSHTLGRTVRIDYDEGYNLNAIK